MKKTIVLYPGLAFSHFVPMMQLADVLLEQGYAVVVALIDITMEQNTSFTAVVSRVASSKPLVTFHTLPRIQNPPTITLDANLLLGYFELIRRYNKHFHDFLSSLSPRSVHAVIMDSLSSEALGVVKALQIPAYNFFASNASALAVFLQLPFCLEDQISFRDLGNTPLEFLGTPPMPASHLTEEMLQGPNSELYKEMMKEQRRNLEPDGILLNSIESLESRAVAALRDPQILPGSELTVPPVYCVGPLVEGAGAGDTQKERHECLQWLDKQPEGSVVFLCFGSTGASSHSKDQLVEIAVGLEKSGHRFLWVVRAPPADEPGKPFAPHADPDLDALLPEGFLERTKGHGLVVKQWAPQVDVLHHRATGAFVTHCGWNSVLEGIMAGVPMLCWPLFAEQKMNKVFIVEEFGIGVELYGWQHGLTTAEEVEAKVKMVMESEEGERLRARVAEHREAAALAWKDGGSSRVAFSQFLADAGKLGLGLARP